MKNLFQYELLEFEPSWTKPIDWERFKLYASYVKELSIPTDDEYFTTEVVSIVSLWRDTLSLLPKLEKLTVDCREVDPNQNRALPLDFALLFLSESIQEVELVFDKNENISTVCKTGDQAFDVFLSALPSRAPDLRTIKLRAEESGSGKCVASRDKHKFMWEKEGFAKVIPAFNKLESLSLCPTFIHPDLLGSISCLRNLKHLRVCCDQHTLWDLQVAGFRQWKNTPANHFDFSSLVTLELTSGSHTATYFLRVLSAPDLSYLDVVSRNSPARNLCILISVVGKNYTRLRSFSLRCPSLSQSQADVGSALCLDDFKPLIHLADLKSFSFRHAHQPLLSSDDLEFLISHWPMLEELHITSPERGFVDTPLLAPNALTLLAKHCPHLCSLSISVNWETISSQVDTGLLESSISKGCNAPRFSSLKCVQFGLSPIEEHQTAAIAAFLVDLSIPSSAIKIVRLGVRSDGADGAREELCGMWKDVKKLMTIATHYRRQVEYLQKRIEALEVNTYSNPHSPSLEQS